MNKSKSNVVLPLVAGMSIVVPKPKLKFKAVDNITIIGEKDISLTELFKLYVELERYLKKIPEIIINGNGIIIGLKGKDKL